jgi:hypothetical protein
MRRRIAVAGIVLAMGVALTGCAGLGEAGSAATVGSAQISNETLADQVAQVQAERGLEKGSPDRALTANVLQRLIITQLVATASDYRGVDVTQGEIDTTLGELQAQLGGETAVVAAYLETGVPASAIEQQVELRIRVQKLGADLAPEADPQSQQQAVAQYVTGLAAQEGVAVSPRYGTFDIAGLTIGPLPTDLAGLRGGVDPLANVVPAP